MGHVCFFVVVVVVFFFMYLENKTLYTHTEDREHRCSSVLEDQEIKETEQINLLRVNIDNNLNFTSHISDICTKASQKVRVLMRLKNSIP